MPADKEFPSLFSSACRRRPLRRQQQLKLAEYTYNALLLAPGGSIPFAQHLLLGGAAVVKAGGIGVFIDNSALAHDGQDWLELAEHRCNPLALTYAFVNFHKPANGNVTSMGMHVFGQREGVVRSVKDLPSLEDFLRMVCSVHPTLNEGHLFSDTKGRQFRLHAAPGQNISQEHPMNNRYGSWHLEVVD